MSKSTLDLKNGSFSGSTVTGGGKVIPVSGIVFSLIIAFISIGTFLHFRFTLIICDFVKISFCFSPPDLCQLFSGISADIGVRYAAGGCAWPSPIESFGALYFEFCP